MLMGKRRAAGQGGSSPVGGAGFFAARARNVYRFGLLQTAFPALKSEDQKTVADQNN